MLYPDETLLAQYLIQTHHIVRVIEYYPETQTVDVNCDMSLYRTNPFGDRQITNIFGNAVTVSLDDPFVLLGIPVQQLRWGQFSIQCAPKPGDTGYIEVFPNDIRMWNQNGEASEPLSTDMFLLDSAVFVPFVPNKINADPNYPTDSFVIKSGNTRIEIEDTEEGQDIKITTPNLVYEMIDNEDGASVNITGDVNITGNVNFTGNLDVSGYIKNPTLEAPES